MSPDREYLKRTEDLVRPDDVGLFSLFGALLGRLPKAVQLAMVPSDPEKAPVMGFVVEPYAFFTAHEIRDTAAAEALLPKGYRIVPTRVFNDEEARPSVIFGAFSVHASGFWGVRVEMYVIAENIESGMHSWIIVDYESNALNFDPGQGFVPSGTKRSVVTTTHQGTVLVDVVANRGRRIALEADLKAGDFTALDSTLWIEGNLSVAYGGEMGDGSGTSMSLIFEPEEMARALRIPLSAVDIEQLDWHPGLYEPEPFSVACFPYAQHFVTSNAPTGVVLSGESALREATAAIASEPLGDGFSAEPIRGLMAGVLALWALVTGGLVVALIVT